MVKDAAPVRAMRDASAPVLKVPVGCARMTWARFPTSRNEKDDSGDGL